MALYLYSKRPDGERFGYAPTKSLFTEPKPRIDYTTQSENNVALQNGLFEKDRPIGPLTYEQSRLPIVPNMQLKEKPFQPKPQENGFGLFLKSVKNPIETIGSISNSVINLGEKNYQERTQKHEQALSDYKIMQQQLKSKDTATQSYEWKKKYFDTLFEMNKANAPIKPINSPILDKINDAFTSASPSVSQQMAVQREHAYQGLTNNMTPTAKMATDIGIGGAQLASDTAVSLMTGIPIIAQYGVSGGAQAAQEALDKGLSSDKALMYGVGSGALTALIESAGGVGGDLLTKPIKTKIGTSVLGNILLDAISEGGEGAAENVLQTLLKNGMLNESEKISLKDLLHTFVLEGAVGGLFGGAKALPAIAEPVTGRMAVNSIVKNQGIQDMRTQGINPITSGTKLDNSYVLQKQDFSKVNVPQSNVILPKPLDVSGKIDVQGIPTIKSQYDMPKMQIPRKLKPLGLPPSRMYARPNGVIMDRLPLKNQSTDNVINRVEKFGSDILEDDYENNIFSALSDEEVKDANEIIELSQGANMSPTDFIDTFSKSGEKAVNKQIDDLAKDLATYKGKGSSIIPIKQDYGADSTGYRVSNNDEWYRDFYAQFGRAPKNSEFRGIADSLIHEDIKRGGGQYLSPEMAQDYNYMQKLKATVSKMGENAVNLTNDYGGTVVERGRVRREIQPKYSPVNARQIITPNGRVLGKSAEQIAQKNTVIDDSVIGHSVQQNKVISDYKNSVDTDLAEYIMTVRKNPDNRYMNFTTTSVGQTEAMKIKELIGIDVTGFEHNIKPSAIQHIDKRHGENGSADHSMKNVEDMARIDYVVNNADGIEPSLDEKGHQRYSEEFRNSDGSKAKTVLYSKAIDGTFYVVEAVPDSKAKKLQLVSAYISKNKKEAYQVPDTHPKVFPRHTSEIELELAPYNSTIAQGNSVVNNQYMQNGEDNASLQPTAKNHSIGAKAAEFEQEQKVSKMRSNTIQKSEMFTQAEKELLNPNEFQYDVMSEKQSLKQAAQRLQADFEGEVADLPNKRNFDGTDTDTSMGIAESYLKDARQSGNYAKVLEWTKKTQQNITSSGQAIQALAKYSRTPEGKILEAQAVINEAENAVKAPFDKEKGKYPKTAKPALWGAINEETEQITMAIDIANKKAVDEAVKLLPEERLAKKIEATTANTIRKNSAINDLVNELFRSAKESPLPQTLKTKRNPIALLSQAIENKSEYTEVWNNAKEILLKKYSDNTEISAMLDDYFNKGIVPTYSQATLENSLKTAAGGLSVDLRKIIKASYGEKEKALADITNYLIEKTGATGTDAKLLSQNIYDKYYEVLKLNSQKELSRIFENKKEIPYKGQKTVKQQVLELINLGGYSDSAVMDIIKQKHDLPVLTGEDVSNILEYMQKSQDFLQGSRMQQILIAKADKIIAEKQPVTLNEKFRGAQRVSMLSNPKTLITRNPFGNIILGAVENAKDIPGAVIDMITSKITGQRTTAFPSFEVGKAQLKGAVTGLKEWSEDIKYKVDTSPSRGQLELPSKRIFKNKFLNGIDNFIKNALQLGDRPFYQAAYDGRIAELKRLGKTGEVAQTDAKIYAIERVLQNDSGLSRKASAIRKELGYLGDIVMPFTQTPANIMDKLIDYSPLGMGKIVHQLGTEVKSGKFNQKVFVDRLARCMTGTGIMALAFVLASKGILTASLDNDDDMRSAQYQAGKQPYAIRIGENYYSYDWAQPIGGLLAAGASFYEAGKNKDDILSSLTSGTGEAIDTVFNQTFLSGIMDMFSGYSPASGMFKSMLGATSQATPSGIASIAKITDSYMRETYDKNVFVQQGKKLAARVPGVSMILPKKLDGAGNPIVQSQGRNAFVRTFDNMLSPGKFTTEQHDKVNDEAFRLFDKTDSKAAFLPVPPKKITLDGKDYRLTADEYNKVAETKGKLQYDLISKMIVSSTYKSLSDKEKVSVFSDTYGLAKAIAIKKVLPDYKIPKEQEKGYAAYKEGINPYQYLLYRQTADADKNGGVTKSEARAALDMSDLSMEQKAYIWALDKISIEKNNPYK